MIEEKTRLGKAKAGYGYKYTELAQINELLEQRGESYYQFTETAENGKDYIMTVKIDKDGKESAPIRGCYVVDEGALKGNNNPAQQMGAAITYARRYSLLMAYGLATEDDDAASLSSQQGKPQNQSRQTNSKPAPQQQATQSQDKPKLIGTEDIQYINSVIDAYPANKLLDQIKKKFNVSAVIDMTEEEAKKCVKMLNVFESQQHPTE